MWIMLGGPALTTTAAFMIFGSSDVVVIVSPNLVFTTWLNFVHVPCVRADQYQCSDALIFARKGEYSGPMWRALLWLCTCALLAPWLAAQTPGKPAPLLMPE